MQKKLSKVRSNVRFLYEHPFVRYLFVGGSTFVVDEGLLILLHGKGKLGIPLSTTIAYIAAFVYNFSLNYRWTFSSTTTRSLRKHIVPYGILFAFNLVTGVLLVSALSHVMNYAVAKVLVVILQTGWNYFIYKNYIFIGEKEAPIDEMTI